MSQTGDIITQNILSWSKIGVKEIKAHVNHSVRNMKLYKTNIVVCSFMRTLNGRRS